MILINPVISGFDLKVDYPPGCVRPFNGPAPGHDPAAYRKLLLRSDRCLSLVTVVSNRCISSESATDCVEDMAGNRFFL